MKKLTAVAIVFLTLVACKKETTTVTKTDPKTGKNITVEVPADSANTTETTLEDLAISENNGVYTQVFKLEKGQTYPLVTVQKDTQTLTAPNGKSQSGNSETRDEMSFTVDDFKDGIYSITVNIVGKKTTQSANGKSVTVDTKSPAPKEEQLKMLWMVNKALAGNKLSMKMKENGDVISISGFDAVYKKVGASVANSLKDATDKNNFLKAFQQSFSEKVIKEQFVKNLKLIPANGVKIGQKWSDFENASADGKVKLTTNYVLNSVENGVAKISVSGGVPSQTEKQTQNGITHTVTSDLSQSGTILLDQKTGWVKSQNMTLKTKNKETMSDGKQSESMTTASNTTVLVNP